MKQLDPTPSKEPISSPIWIRWFSSLYERIKTIYSVMLELVPAGYGGARQVADVPGFDIPTTTYVTLPFDTASPSVERGVSFSLVNNSFTFTAKGVWTLMLGMSISGHNSSNGGRRFSSRIYNVSTGGSGTGIVTGVGRNVQDTLVSASFLVEVTQAHIDDSDIFRIEVGNADTAITGGTLIASAVQVTHASELGFLVAQTPPIVDTIATATPLDFTSTNTITLSGGDYTVDWGDGAPISYLDGAAASSVASGNILIGSVNAPTGIRFNTNTFTNINIIEAVSFTQFVFICDGLSNLTSFNATNTQNVTGLSAGFRGCSGLTTFPLIDVSSVLLFNASWDGCSGLTAFPALNMVSATDINTAWRNCSGIVSFGLINVSNVTNFNSAWLNCTSLASLPAIDTSSADSIVTAFAGCSSLVCLSSINTLVATFTTDMFLNTPALTNPTPAEQTQIEAGFNYINASPCP